MIISHSRRFVFVHIHKTGGTSIELALDKFLSWNDLVLGGSALGESMNDTYRERFGLDKHSSVAEIERVCGPQLCNRYAVIATVRHPLNRLCSLYNFVGTIVHHHAEAHGFTLQQLNGTLPPELAAAAPELEWAASAAFIANPDFSTFIRDDKLLEDHAFDTQASRLRSVIDGAIHAKVLRLEDRKEWLGRLKQLLALPFISMPHANRSELVLVTPGQVSSEDRAFIESRFREDYLAFDYQPS